MAGNRIVYAMLLIMTAAFVSLFEHQATYAALYAVLLLPAVSLSILIIAKRRIYVSGKLDAATVKKGETALYILTLKNNNYIFNFRARAVFDKRLKEFVKVSESGYIDISPRGSGETAFKIMCRYRGAFKVSADYIFLYDFLGLFKVKIKNQDELKLTVLPNIINLENIVLSLGSPSGILKSSGLDFNIPEDDSDFPDFRKYTPSDGYKRIYWQLSAKRGELISKSYNAQEKTAAAVIIDNSGLPKNIKLIEAMRCEDSLIETAVSVIAYCNMLNMPVHLDYIGGNVEASLEFDALYASAASIEFNRQEDFTGFLMSRIEIISGAGNIYIFTRTVTGELIDCVNKLRLSGCNAEIFYYAGTETEVRGECKLWQITD